MFLVFLLLNAVYVEHSSCERFNIVPSPDSPCPGEFTGEPCITLQQYVANPSLSSNITFDLHPGNHSLDSQLTVRNIHSFTMKANTSATVTCNQQLDQPFHFSQLQQVHVSGVTFVGCRIVLQYITNATFERNSFVNRTTCCPNGAALYAYYSSVLIRQCIISNNRVGNGAIHGFRSTFVIEQSSFRNNYFPYSCCSRGGAIYVSNGNMDVLNSNFSDNLATYNGDGGAIYVSGDGTLTVTITGSHFSDNRAGSRSNGGDGGAIYASGGTLTVTITGTHFSGNRAGRNRGHGGVVSFNGGNITVTNSTFINNTAGVGGGGAIHSARRYTNVTVINNIFSHNAAAYCGVMEVAEFYHRHVNITGNTFTYNRAMQQISGNNGGGVICIRNASMLVLDNIFSHNSAAGDAGVIQVDESDIIIVRSIFRNNTAGGNGGVLHTYFYPTRYTIIDSSFTSNQAEGDGGVMYVGRAGSHVTVNQSTFGFNNATNRGGVIAIVGSTLEIYDSSIFENTAEQGEVISACNSDVSTNPELLASQDPMYSFCYLYDNSNTTISRTTGQTTPTTGITTDTTAMASTTTEQAILTTTALPPTDGATSTEEDTTTEGVATTTENNVDITTIASTTEDMSFATTTTPSPTLGATTTTSEEITTEDIDIVTTTTPESLQGTTTTTSTTQTATTSPSQEITTTDENMITSTPGEVSTTEERIQTTTPPKTVPPETSTSSSTIPTSTRPVVNPVSDEDRDTADYNFHYILPGYISIGVSAILFLVITFFGVLMIVIAVKVFRMKTKSQNVNLSAYDYPTIKNEYSLPDVHVDHT